MAIDYDKKGAVAYVTINRPEAMNCLSSQDLDSLGKVWMDFKDDKQLRVAILSGAGDQSFCAGADLKEMIPMVNSGKFTISPTIPGFLKNINCFKPIIGAVNGICIAGGLEILQGTDIRIGVEEAIFGLSEVKLGLFPTAGSTINLPRQIPYCWAMEILLVGDNITASQALKIGLLNRVVPKDKLMTTAEKFAYKICQNGPLAVQAVKESVLKGYDIPKEHAYYLEANLAKQVFGTADAIEGPRAFIEKRKPVFKGK